jgi:hypothetical protein
MNRGRPRSGKRLWTDDCAILDVFTLSRPRPQPDPSNPFECFLPEAGSANNVTVTAKWADRRETETNVKLVTTKPHFGGVRYWYECPACGHGVAKLYAVDSDRRFLCRRCRGACYFSQYRKGSRDRLCHLIGNEDRLSAAQRKRQWNRLLSLSPDALR